MKRLHRITTLLFLLVCMLSLMACSEQQRDTTAVIKPIVKTDNQEPTTVAMITLTAAPTPIAVPTAQPTPLTLPTPTAVPTPSALPTTKVYPEGEGKHLIAIDAGHQSKPNNEKEPIGPGAITTKAKVSSGTQGIATEVPEYKLNLVIAIKVKEELIDRGYEVFMIRETNDVNLSNRERAEMANESGADLFLRIHADGSENSSVNGTSTLYPSKDNPYVSELSKDSYNLSTVIVDAMCERTGAKNRGAIARDDMSGINWCTLPVSIIEMGYMSNRKEDKLMQTEEYQDKIAQGICDGIDAYYE